MICAYGSHYHCERLVAAVETDGIELPESAATEPTYDAVVMSAGPGRQGDDGQPRAMQAEPGDRVICLPKDWWAWDPEREYPSWNVALRGFVHDRDLIAVIPGPEHAAIYAANDYVLIQPDPVYVRDEGSVVQERPSGLLVASHALPGGDERAKHEGWQAYVKSRELWDSPAWQAEPEYYRHRRLHAYLDNLPRDVRRYACEFARSEEAPGKQHLWVRKAAPTRGTVVNVGPRAIGYELMPGDIVRWAYEHTGVVLTVGAAQLLALPARYLDAREVE